MEKISIIVPIYNVERYIANFIKSILNQTYQNFELILVNDGSTDDSIQIAEEILTKTEIDYKIIHKENRGTIKCKKQGNKRSYRRMACYVRFR